MKKFGVRRQGREDLRLLHIQPGQGEALQGGIGWRTPAAAGFLQPAQGVREMELRLEIGESDAVLGQHGGSAHCRRAGLQTRR